MKDKDRWDKAGIVAGIIGSIAIPIVVGLVGFIINANLKDKDIQLETFKLAIEILKANPSPERVKLRQWAVEVFAQQSGIKMGPEAARELVRVGFPRPPEFSAASPPRHVIFGIRKDAILARDKKIVDKWIDEYAGIRLGVAQKAYDSNGIWYRNLPDGKKEPWILGVFWTEQLKYGQPPISPKAIGELRSKLSDPNSVWIQFSDNPLSDLRKAGFTRTAH